MNIFNLQNAVFNGDNETVCNILTHWCCQNVFSTLNPGECDILLRYVEELKNHSCPDDTCFTFIFNDYINFFAECEKEKIEEEEHVEEAA